MSTRLPCVAIALIGPRASGKTTVSQALATTLNCALVDTDTLLTTAYGTIREQFANHGETLFRDREERALVEALAARGVVSCGGGMVLRRSNRLLLSPVFTVFLTAPIDTLVARVLGDPCSHNQRPPLLPTTLDDTSEQVRQETRRILEQRLPLYRSCCRMELDTSVLNISEIVEAIVARLPVPASP